MADKKEDKKPTIPPYLPKPKPAVKKENEDAEFSVESLCQATAGLSVGQGSSRECPTSPFGCPMSPRWEIWLRVRVKPNKDCLIRTGIVNLILPFLRIFIFLLAEA